MADTTLNVESLFPERQNSTTTGFSVPIATPREGAFTAGVAGNQADIQAGQADVLDAQARQDALQSQIDQQKADQAGQLAAVDRDNADARTAGETARQQQLAPYRSRMDEASQQAQGMQLHDYFEGKHGTAKTLMHGVAMLLGDMGRSSSNMGRIIMGHAPDAVNTVAPILNKIIDRDWDQQKEKLAVQRQKAIDAGADFDRVDHMTKEHELMMEAGKIKAKEALVNTFAARLAQSSLPLEEQTRRKTALLQKLGYDKDVRDFNVNERTHEATLRATQTSGTTRYQGGNVKPMPGVFQDTDTGEKVGTVSNPRQVTSLEEEHSKLGAAIRALEEEKARIAKVGPRSFGTEASKEGKQKHGGAVIATAATSSAGQNEKALELEHAKVGESGAISIGDLLSDPIEAVKNFATGANPSAIDDQIKELKQRQQAIVKGNVTPFSKPSAAAARPGPGAVIEHAGKHYRVAGDGKTLIEVH